MYFIALSIGFLALWIFMQEKTGWSRLWKLLLFASIGGVVAYPFLGSLVLFSGIPKYLAGALIYIACTGYLLVSNRESRIIQVFVLIGALSFLPYLLKLPIAKEVKKEGADKKYPIAENGEFLVSIDKQNVASIEEAYKVKLKHIAPVKRSVETGLDDVFTFDIEKGKDVELWLSRLQNDIKVNWVEYNDLYKIADPKGANQVSPSRGGVILNDPRIREQWGYSFLRMDAYHNYIKSQKLKPKKKVKLFILDTGIEAKHEDLKATYSSLNTRYDSDGRGHGTHCAGIAAGVSNNGVGIASLNPGKDWIELTSVKVISRMGFAPQSTVIKGIVESVDAGADVISLSLGGPSNDRSQEAYNQAVQYALDKNVIIIAAAGNSNMPAGEFSPANSKGMIAVSAINSLGLKASFSNTVFDVELGIAAPGVDILSTDINNTYSLKSGTSMACPMVAGLAAVAKGLQPNITHLQFHDLLTKTGKSGRDVQSVGKTMDPLAFVKAVKPSI